jgi:uncharacterized membrane protein
LVVAMLLCLSAGCRGEGNIFDFGFFDDEEMPDIAYGVSSLVGAASVAVSVAYAISDSMVIVGVFAERAVMWTVGDQRQVMGPFSLTIPEGDDPGPSEARGVNNLGQVVGWVGEDPRRPFVWSSEVGLVELDLPNDLVAGAAYGINDNGLIVGGGLPVADAPWSNGGHVVLWQVSGDDELMSSIDLGQFEGTGALGHAVNTLGIVVGTVWSAAGEEGFLWSDTQDLETFPFAAATLGMNDQNSVVGQWFGRAAIWAGGVLEAIGPEGSVARGISNEGVVVGDLAIGGADSAKGFGFVLINGEIHALEGLSGIDHSRARTVNSSGFVVGESYIPDVAVSDAAVWIAN